MKKYYLMICSLLICLLFLPFSPATSVRAAMEENESLPVSESNTLDIFFLHDTHSHLNSFSTIQENQNITLGGFARIKTLIDKNSNALVLDAGDFSMGTLVQTVFHSAAPELRILGALGCEP